MSHMDRVGLLVLFRQDALVDNVQLLVGRHIIQDFCVASHAENVVEQCALVPCRNRKVEEVGVALQVVGLHLSRMVAHS